ncbi:hypothetical protein O6H91_Y023800 [Diphasiastrum complanatum]|nr:hypothetical protein O6H91_Y023800 [Diphasiastrum complanatum]
MEMPMRMAAALPSSGRPFMSNDVIAPFQNLPSLPDPQPFAFLPRNVQIPSFGRATAPPPGLCPPPSDPPTAAINSLNCVLPQSLPTHASCSFPQSTKTMALFPCPPPGMANPSFPLPNFPTSLRPPVPIPSLPARVAASFISESNLPSSLGAMAQPCCFPRMVTFRAPDHIISSSVRVHEPVLCQPPTNVESLPSTSNSQFPFSKQTNVPFPPAKIARFLAAEINCLLPLRSPAQVPWRSPCPSRSLPAPTLLKAPPKPQNLDMLKNIEILSTFVVRNGHQFEDMAKRFQGADPNFSFLFGGKLGTDASLGCEYYQWRKRALANKTWSNGEFAIQLQQSPVSDGAVTAAPVGSDVDMEDFWHNSFNSKSAEEASARGSPPKKESQKTHRNSDIEQDEAGSRRLQQDSAGNSTVKQVPLSEKGHVLQMSSVTSQVEHECDSRRNLFKELTLQDMKIGKEGSGRGKTKSEASTSRSESTKANGRTSNNGCHSLSKKRTRGQSRYLSCSPLHSKSCYSTAPLQYQRNETHQSIYPNSEARLQLEGEKSSYVRQCLDKKVSSTSKLAILDCEISPDLPVSAPSMNRLSAQDAFSAEPACSFASQFFRSASQVSQQFGARSTPQPPQP